MAEPYQTNRTWLCSVLFMDIVNYSSQSVELQIKWKERFNNYLGEAIKNVPEADRVILDTGDGAAICFLGAPEAAMFAALDIWHFLLLDEPEQNPQLRVRTGIHLGPVKLVRDINGAPNAIGDGMNVGQRVMSFAAENQILVSQSYFEVVSCLSDDYKTLFTLKGVERDKHIREHTVYALSPPHSEHRQVTMNHPPQASAVAPPSAASQPVQASRASAPIASSRSMPVLVGGVVVILIAAVGAWFFFLSEPRSTPAVRQPPTAPPSVQVATSPKPAPGEPPHTPAADVPTPKSNPAPPPKPTPEAAPAPSAPVPANAQVSYDEGVRLLEDQDNPMQALRYLDDAIRARPNFVGAYVHRAEARRRLVQFGLSMKDCNKVIQLAPADPRGYNCRGYAEQQLMQYNASLTDFGEALRLNPNFGLAYGNRGTTYNLTHRYVLAVKDFDEAIRLLPRNHVYYIRRGNSYSNLKQYAKAIQDYTEAIRLSPQSMDAYRARAIAEEAMGDIAGAAADRARIREADRGSR